MIKRACEGVPSAASYSYDSPGCPHLIPDARSIWEGALHGTPQRLVENAWYAVWIDRAVARHRGGDGRCERKSYEVTEHL